LLLCGFAFHLHCFLIALHLKFFFLFFCRQSVFYLVELFVFWDLRRKVDLQSVPPKKNQFFGFGSSGGTPTFSSLSCSMLAPLFIFVRILFAFYHLSRGSNLAMYGFNGVKPYIPDVYHFMKKSHYLDVLSPFGSLFRYFLA